MTMTSSSAAATIEQQILKDVKRYIEQDKCHNNYNYALALLACRYTDSRFKSKARELLEEKMRDTKWDPILDEGAN